MKKTFLAVLILLFICFTVQLFSHDYILVPEKFQYRKGDTLKVHLMVGDPFYYELERELQYFMTSQFSLFTKNDSVDLLKVMADNSKPVLNRVVDFDGLALITMNRKPSFIDEKPGAFQKYLAEESITGTTFDSTKWSKPMVKEKYSRCIKSLIVSGKSGDEKLFDKNVHQRLELLLLNNPYKLKPGEKISVQIFWEGKPMTGKIMTASIKKSDGNITEQTSITNAKGVCSFTPQINAIYKLHLVHLLKLPEGSDADFESVWASYSFMTKQG